MATIIAYALDAEDNDSFMLGPDTFAPPVRSFYHWRFGKDGVPHPETCKTCGRKTNQQYINPAFRARKRKKDVGATYDGYFLVSRRFRDVCIGEHSSGAEFVPLPADPDYFVLRSSRVVRYDAHRKEDYCSDCAAYFSVIMPIPAFAVGAERPLAPGFYRSDIEFASGHEQHAILLVGPTTGNLLREQKFRGGFHLEPITAA